MIRLPLYFIAFAVVAAIANTSFALTSPFNGCEYESRVDKTTSGRFIWVPKASHFNQAVIVAPRDFFPYPPTVELFTFEGKRIETARLKSTGLCSGSRECLFAATYLTNHLGSWYKRKFGAIVIKITPSRITSKAPTCRYYQVPKPSKRRELHG